MPEMGRSLGRGMREFKDAVTARASRSRRRSAPLRRPRRRPPRPRPAHSRAPVAAEERERLARGHGAAPASSEARGQRHPRRAPRRVPLAPHRLDPGRHRRLRRRVHLQRRHPPLAVAAPAREHATASSSQFGVTEPFFTTVKVVFIAAIAISLPVVLWQLWSFLAPAFRRTPSASWPSSSCSPPRSSPQASPSATTRAASRPRLPDHLQRRVLPDRDPGELLLLVRRVHAARNRARLQPADLHPRASCGSACSRPGALRRNRRIGIAIVIVGAALLPAVDPVSLVFETIPLLILYEGSIWAAVFFEKRWRGGPDRRAAHRDGLGRRLGAHGRPVVVLADLP